MAEAHLRNASSWAAERGKAARAMCSPCTKAEKAAIEKARAKGSKQLVSDAVEWVDGPAGKEMRIKDTPPWVYHQADATARATQCSWPRLADKPTRTTANA